MNIALIGEPQFDKINVIGEKILWEALFEKSYNLIENTVFLVYKKAKLISTLEENKVSAPRVYEKLKNDEYTETRKILEIIIKNNSKNNLINIELINKSKKYRNRSTHRILSICENKTEDVNSVPLNELCKIMRHNLILAESLFIALCIDISRNN